MVSNRQYNLPGPPAKTVTFAGRQILVGRDNERLELWREGGAGQVWSIVGDLSYAAGITAIPTAGLLVRLSNQGKAVVSELDTGATVGSIKLPYPGRYTGATPWFGTTVTATPDGRCLITATTVRHADSPGSLR